MFGIKNKKKISNTIESLIIAKEKRTQSYDELSKLMEDSNTEFRKLYVNKDLDIKKMNLLYPKIKKAHHLFNTNSVCEKKLIDKIVKELNIEPKDVDQIILIYKFNKLVK